MQHLLCELTVALQLPRIFELHPGRYTKQNDVWSTAFSTGETKLEMHICSCAQAEF